MRPRTNADSARDRILAVISGSSTITVVELRARLPEMRRSQITNALTELTLSGSITRISHGCYRARVRRLPSPASANVVSGIPLSRLMAGR